MKISKCIILFLVSCSLHEMVLAQGLDTLRRKDADGMDFIQIRKGGNVLQEGYLQNGVYQGTWTQFWESTGYPNIITNYKNGKLNGVRIQISAQGYTELVEHYSNDLLNGPKRKYQVGSQFLNEETFYSDGKMHGPYNKRYPSGKPQESSNYANGLRDGKTIWYFESGDKTAEYTYRNGVIDGEVATYYKNGKVMEFGLYRQNKQEGQWKEFYENGQLKAVGNYESGVKKGAWKEYNEQGKLVKTQKF